MNMNFMNIFLHKNLLSTFRDAIHDNVPITTNVRLILIVKPFPLRPFLSFDFPL